MFWQEQLGPKATPRRSDFHGRWGLVAVSGTGRVRARPPHIQIVFAKIVVHCNSHGSRGSDKERPEHDARGPGRGPNAGGAGGGVRETAENGES